MKRTVKCSKYGEDSGVYLPFGALCFYKEETGSYGAPLDKKTCELVSGFFNDDNHRCYKERVQVGSEGGPVSSCEEGYGLYSPPNDNPVCAKVSTPSTFNDCPSGFIYKIRLRQCEKEIIINAKIK